MIKNKNKSRQEKKIVSEKGERAGAPRKE